MVAAVSTALECHLGHNDSWGCVAAGWHTTQDLQERSWFKNRSRAGPNFQARRNLFSLSRRPNSKKVGPLFGLEIGATNKKNLRAAPKTGSHCGPQNCEMVRPQRRRRRRLWPKNLPPPPEAARPAGEGETPRTVQSDSAILI